MKMLNKTKNGFALMEVLVALTLVSTTILYIYAGVASGIGSISNSNNLTKAIIIAKSLLNEERSNYMRGPDQNHKELAEYPGFSYSRATKRFEHPLLGPLDAQELTLTVYWQQQNKERNYTLTYIFPKSSN